MKLVEKGKYFVINRPRQFGKTTVLNFLEQRLLTTGKYTPALISFERFTQRANIIDAEFYQKTAKYIVEELVSVITGTLDSSLPVPVIGDRDDFFEWLREICRSRKLVLLCWICWKESNAATVFKTMRSVWASNMAFSPRKIGN
jgi:hypothetical protein